MDFSKFLYIALLILFLGACSVGGGSGGNGTTNNAPSITSSPTATVEENTTAVVTVTATDPDGDTLSYSLSGGADQSAFSINATTGALSFTTAPDYEAYADSNSDNVYEVQVSVSDASTSSTQDITVTLTNLVVAVNSEYFTHLPLDGTWSWCNNHDPGQDSLNRHFFTDNQLVIESYVFESTDGSCTGQAMVTSHWKALVTTLDNMVTSGWVDSSGTAATAPANQAGTGNLEPNPTVTKLSIAMGLTTPPGPSGDQKYFYYVDDTGNTHLSNRLYRPGGSDANLDGYLDYVSIEEPLGREDGTITPLATTINADSGTMQLLDGVWSSPCRNTGASDYMEQHVIAGGTFKLQHVFYSTTDTSCTGSGSVAVDAEGTVTALDNFVTAGWHDDTNPSIAPTPQSGSGSLANYPTVTKLIIDIPSGSYAGSNPYFYYMDDTSVTWCIYRPAGPDGDSDGYDDYVANYEPLCKISTT